MGKFGAELARKSYVVRSVPLAHRFKDLFV
jgi:hypothetical protein